MRKLRITLARSPISHKAEHRATVRALGLRRMNQAIEKEDSPTIRGMLEKVKHLVKVEFVS